MALKFFGRFSRIVPTPPLRSKMIFSKVINASFRRLAALRQ
jgi:hypothetical protein